MAGHDDLGALLAEERHVEVDVQEHFLPLRSTSPRVPTLLVVVIPAFQNKIDSVRQSPRHSIKQQRRWRIQARRGTIGGRGSPWRKPDRIGGAALFDGWMWRCRQGGPCLFIGAAHCGWSPAAAQEP
jgi:hypothetical protein